MKTHNVNIYFDPSGNGWGYKHEVDGNKRQALNAAKRLTNEFTAHCQRVGVRVDWVKESKLDEVRPSTLVTLRGDVWRIKEVASLFEQTNPGYHCDVL